MTLRMPSACAPSRSLWIAIRFRSRDVKWMIVSMPTRCSISTASAIALIRTRAIGLSPMLMRVGAERLQVRRAFERLARIEAARRVQLDADDELAGRELLAQRARAFASVLARRGHRRPYDDRTISRDGVRRRRVARPRAVPLARQHLAHRRRVLRRRAAAAADDVRARLDELARVLGEVLRRRRVDEAAVDELAAGPAFGIAESRIDVLAAICSITSSADCGPRLQLMPATSAPSDDAMFATSSGGSPPMRAAVALERHLRDDRQVAALLHGEDRLAQLGDVRERLEDDQVDAAFEQRLRLLADRRAHLLRPDVADRREHAAGRADGAGDEHGVAVDLAGVAGQPRGLEVDVAHLSLRGRASRDGSGSRRTCPSR